MVDAAVRRRDAPHPINIRCSEAWQKAALPDACGVWLIRNLGAIKSYYHDE
jgi:hypothetical protein